ncbi:MAG: BatA domain-containing protein [Bacteroidota bacterium]|jgi:hypothetical protein
MNFLFPSFLWALFALAIPIIIHLFNFRKYKKVYFTNVRFLKELKQESESKSKIKQYLILLSRLLAITALVFAFAQPFKTSENGIVKSSGQKAVSIYIDNSFSMEAISKNGYLLDVAKSKARELAKSYSSADKFQLLTNDFEGKHQRLISKDEFLQFLDEVKLSPSHRKIEEVYKRQNDLLNRSNCQSKVSFLFSDFQRSFIANDKIEADTNISCNLIPLLEKVTPGDNVFVDTCWFENPVHQAGSIQKLHAKIINKSSKDLENASLRLIINNKLISPASFSAKANEEKEVLINFSVKEFGIQNARLEIDDHPVTYDDKLFFSFSVEKRIPVLLINGENSKSGRALQAMLKGDSLFLSFEMSESAIDYNSFSKYNLIIFNDVKTISSGLQQEIKKFLSNGGSIALFPSVNSDINTYNQLFSQVGINSFGGVDTANLNCDRINFDQGFFTDVFERKTDNMDLPRIFNHYSSSRGIGNTEEVIIKLINGMPLLSHYTFSKGKLYTFSSSLDESWSNFSKHALFVPTIYKMAINSLSASPLYYETGKNNAVEVKRTDNAKESSYNIRSEDSKLSFIPETRISDNRTLLFLQQMVKNSGSYYLEFDKEKLSGLSFNYPREESVLEYFSSDELKGLFSGKNKKYFTVVDPGIKSVQLALEDLSGGTKFWKVFIILALVFFAIEIALNRLIK